MKQVCRRFSVAVLIITVVISMVAFSKEANRRCTPFQIKDLCKRIYSSVCDGQPDQHGNGGSVLCHNHTLFLFYVFQVLEDTSEGFYITGSIATPITPLYVLGTVGIVILWSACYWAMSVIFNGKSSGKFLSFRLTQWSPR